MAIQIKEGRYYKDGLGNVGGPFVRRQDQHATLSGYPWRAGTRVYTEDGRYDQFTPSADDLISECDAEGNPIKDEAMTAAAQLVMKGGAYYEDRIGNVRGPMMPSNSSYHPWLAADRFGYHTFTTVGHWDFNEVPTRKDLIREVAAPSAPDAPKPETVTQEMVDRAIQALVSADRYAAVERLVTAWSDVRCLVK